MKFTEWIRHRIVGRLREPDYRELQEIAQKAKLLAGVYNHGELAKLIREYSHSEKALEQIALLIAKSEPFDSPISTMYLIPTLSPSINDLFSVSLSN